MREQVKALEHETHMLAQAANQPFLLAETARGINGHIAHPDGPAFRLFQQVNTAQQRRFTGAAGADDRHHFPLLDIEVDTVQYRLAVEFFHQVFDFNGTHFGSRSWRFSWFSK